VEKPHKENDDDSPSSPIESSQEDQIATFLKKTYPWVEEPICVERKDRVYFVWQKSRHCLNKGGDHNSPGRAWFLLTYKGISQRCSCKHDDRVGVYDVPCSKFKSPQIGLDRATRKALYNKKKNKKQGDSESIVSRHFSPPKRPKLSPTVPYGEDQQTFVLELISRLKHSK